MLVLYHTIGAYPRISDVDSDSKSAEEADSFPE